MKKQMINIPDNDEQQRGAWKALIAVNSSISISQFIKVVTALDLNNDTLTSELEKNIIAIWGATALDGLESRTSKIVVTGRAKPIQWSKIDDNNFSFTDKSNNSCLMHYDAIQSKVIVVDADNKQLDSIFLPTSMSTQHQAAQFFLDTLRTKED
ncbi:MAG: hypothetical protein HAW67_06055 [Endozoicomonadaceae bacterium]|nr:hypothetical protein [Endozoicomonadaceae bacterium]